MYACGLEKGEKANFYQVIDFHDGQSAISMRLFSYTPGRFVRLESYDDIDTHV